MRRHSSHGFTLIEILTVIVVILIIAAFVVNAAGLAQRKAARARATGEIAAMSTACESYKADNGSYPRQPGITEADDTGKGGGGDSPIDPKKHGNPASQNYQKASQYLYIELSGDKDLNGRLNGASEPTKGYMNFDKNQLGTTKDATGTITKVNYIQDPFGVSYGYSTAGAKAEEDFRAAVASQGAKASPRGSDSPGYNPTFDLWSTGGAKVPAANQPITDLDHNQWVKNW